MRRGLPASLVHLCAAAALAAGAAACGDDQSSSSSPSTSSRATATTTTTSPGSGLRAADAPEAEFMRLAAQRSPVGGLDALSLDSYELTDFVVTDDARAGKVALTPSGPGGPQPATVVLEADTEGAWTVVWVGDPSSGCPDLSPDLAAALHLACA